MKRIHKLISILDALAVALTMSVGMAGTVRADEATGHTITINPSKDSTEVHTYEAYQIFSGTYHNDGGTLTDINWGTGVNGEALLQSLKDKYKNTFGNAKTASEVADILSASTNPEDAETFAQSAAAHLDKVAGTSVADATTKTAVISGLGDGYYLIRDVSENLKTDTFSKYILKVAGDVTVNAKSSSTTSYKKVKDINDSNAKGMTDWQDAADWDIGDEVPFELVGQVAPDYGEYSTYAFVFHDVESQGLTFNKDSVKVYIDEATEPIAGGYTVETNPTDHCTFEIRFDNLKQVQDVMANSVIRVEYTATLNENAVIGSAGNPNTSHVETVVLMSRRRD
jgi:fimbrial isopeptide formation D2 family protein